MSVGGHMSNTPISMHKQNFIKIHPFVLKILRKDTFLHQYISSPPDQHHASLVLLE